MKTSIEVEIKPPDLLDRLRTIPSRVFDPEFRKAVFNAEGLAKLNATGGNPLRVQTGRLRSSIATSVERQGDTWTGRLGSNVEYAAIHELGGLIRPHRVVPVRASVLRFIINGQVIFSKYANIPAIKMPERPYLRPAAQKAMDDFVQRMSTIDLVKYGS